MKHIFLLWRGRVSRKTYWICGLLPAIATLVIGVVLRASPLTAGTWSRLNVPVWLVLVAVSLTIYIGLILSIKRSHDLDYTGFFSFVLFVPLVNFWPLIMFGFFRGIEVENKYGPPDERFPNVFVNE